MISEIKDAIFQSKNILLTLHHSPDDDSYGSNLALYSYLRSIKKKVTLIKGDSTAKKHFSVYPNYEKITKKDISQIDLEKFDLFIVLDCADKSMISKRIDVDIPRTLKTIVIDHHISNDSYGDINLIDPNAAATCQILYDIFVALKTKITPDIAICLYLGIAGDTGYFRNSNTTARIFEIVSILTKIYPNFYKKTFELENSNSVSYIKLMALMLNNIDLRLNGKVAIASATYKEVTDNNINFEDLGYLDIANTLKSVTGWEVGISMIEDQIGSTKIGLRTRDSEKYNLGLIGLSTGFGGGHRAAAGLRLPYDISKSKEIVLAAIKNYLKKHGR